MWEIPFPKTPLFDRYSKIDAAIRFSVWNSFLVGFYKAFGPTFYIYPVWHSSYLQIKEIQNLYTPLSFINNMGTIHAIIRKIQTIHLVLASSYLYTGWACFETSVFISALIPSSDNLTVVSWKNTKTMLHHLHFWH